MRTMLLSRFDGRETICLKALLGSAWVGCVQNGSRANDLDQGADPGQLGAFHLRVRLAGWWRSGAGLETG